MIPCVAAEALIAKREERAILAPAPRELLRANSTDPILSRERIRAYSSYPRPERFGLETANFIGGLPQSNGPSASWPDFYGSQRLEPLLARARDRVLLSPEAERLSSRLLTVLPERLGPPEPPGRLHGDLWAGYWICAEIGEPVLMDLAVYGGDREIDLAMMRLFGGFGDHVFAAYREVYPLVAGFEERVPLYQSYPLLVHLNLFGASYAGAVELALRASV